MKTYKKYLYLILLLTTLPSCKLLEFNYFKSKTIPPKIITTQTIKDAAKYADKNSLVIFDIDQTLLIKSLKDPKDNNYFFKSRLYTQINKFLTDYNFNKHISEIIQKIDTKLYKKNIDQLFKMYLKPIVNNKMRELWNIIEPQLEYHPVETDISKIINNLQNKNIKTMAFTARKWKTHQLTLNNLLNVGINFSKDSIYDKKIIEQPKQNKYGFGYEKGILYLIRSKKFTSATQKGPVLLKFFNLISYYPKKVIFIDDRQDNVLDVITSLNSANISIQGIWYKPKNYIKNPKLSLDDIEILNIYLGNNWWKLIINIEKAIEFIEKNSPNHLGAKNNFKNLAMQ